jgi:SHS2 domain-containing protein
MGGAVMSRGHRSVAHTADVILEAWGTDRSACYEEAVAALVELFVDAGDARIVDRHVVTIADAGPPEDQLLAVLDELVLTLDTNDAVPVAADINNSGSGLQMTLLLAEADSVTPIGPVPKAIARSELQVRADDGRVSARFLVDV